MSFFFCLSGFLITKILLSSQGKPHAIRKFYIRRFLRIFPLYYGALLVLFTCGQVKYLGMELAYLGNVQTYMENNFNRDLVGHFWTLCIEEHFYLLLPPLLLFSKKKMQLGLIVLLLFGSMAWVQYFQVVYPEKELAFVLSPHYGQFLLWGTLLGWLDFYLPKVKLAAKKMFLAGVLLHALWLGGDYIDVFARFQHGNVFYLLNGLGFSLIVAGLWYTETGPIHKLLTQPLLSYLGKISYGLYVFHMPMLSLTKSMGFTFRVQFPVALLLTIGISQLSWHFYERKFLVLKSKYE